MAGRLVLEAKDVTVTREGRAVLDRVSLEAFAGEVHAVMGPNGAGKSTLVSALLGQVPFTGTIRRDLGEGGRVGLVPQGFAVDATLPVTVVELLALTRQRLPIALGVREAVRARVVAALETMGVAALVDRRLGALSGGELRRVLFAAAIEPPPALLLLDEPSAGVDEASARALDAALRAVCAEHGTAAVLVSHDARQVRDVAARVTWLDGTVRRCGPPDEVLAAAAAPALEAAGG